MNAIRPARLIACAPEMAEALLEMRAAYAVAISVIQAQGGIWMGEEQAKARLYKLDAILAKIGGAV